ncbi:MAG: hypothetical protein ACI3ZC_09995 [Candidatus Cryptobacteroides sp.]
MDREFTRPAEELGRNTAEYIDLKIDEVKLRAAKGLSLTLNRIFLAILFISLGSIVMSATAFGGVLLIGDIIGSYSAGAFIVAGIFLLLMAVLWALRKKLFLGSLVKLFIRLFFENQDETPEEGQIGQ